MIYVTVNRLPEPYITKEMTPRAMPTSRTLAHLSWVVLNTVFSTFSYVPSIIYGAPSRAGYHRLCVLFKPIQY